MLLAITMVTIIRTVTITITTAVTLTIIIHIILTIITITITIIKIVTTTHRSNSTCAKVVFAPCDFRMPKSGRIPSISN